jgi:energy-coupling factor transporter ATP-binding protein EcfA2
MTSPAAQDLLDLLRMLDPELAEPAVGPLQRLVGTPALTPNLVVALVGPSGTGKSALFNVLAGADIAEVGTLRPTTKDTEVWPIGSRGLVLIDTPPFDADPDTVIHTIDRTDLAVLVLTPDRYADLTVRDLIHELDRRGVPTVLALNRVPGDPALAAAITVDVIASLEGEVTIVPESRSGALEGGMLRDRIASLGRSETVARRDLGAVVFIEDQIEIVAQQIEDRDARLDALLDTAERTLADARFERGSLAAAARFPWPLAVKTLLDTVSTTTTRAMESIVKDPSLHPSMAAVARVAVEAAGPVDAAPLDQWKAEVTEDALAHMRQPALHPLRRRAVEQQVWRLCADIALLPDRRIRAALGEEVAQLRLLGNRSLTAALRSATERRIEEFIDALGTGSAVSGHDLRQAVAALAKETGERVDMALKRTDDE